jgi:hypothetical protein
MRNEFCPELSDAIDKKTRADAALLCMRRDMCAGAMTYSKSAVLSALEDCDDAMESVWLEMRREIREETLLGAPGETTIASSLPAENVLSRADKSPLHGMLFDNPIVSSTHKRLRELFAKTPKTVRPHQNIL